MSDSSSAGINWLENVSGQQNSHNMTIIVGTILFILAAGISLFIVMIIYRRFRIKREDEEANWVFMSEKRKSLFRKSSLDVKGHDIDDNPNWVPFRPPPLAAVPKVHLRTSGVPRPSLRSMLLSASAAERKVSSTAEYQVRRVPAPTIDVPKLEVKVEAVSTPVPAPAPVPAPVPAPASGPEFKPAETQPTARPNPRSPPRLTVKVPPPSGFTPSIITTSPSPKTVKFLPGPPSSSMGWKAEARDRWNRATHALRSPLNPRSKLNNTPVTTSFLDGKKHKSKSKSKSALKAEADGEFWSAGARASEARATQKLDALISELQREYSHDL